MSGALTATVPTLSRAEHRAALVLQIALERKTIASACRQAGSVERRRAVIVAVTPVIAPAHQR